MNRKPLNNLAENFNNFSDSDTIMVGIGAYAVAISPFKIKTSGLGSCVGVTLYDPQEKIGGLIHAMLPSMKEGRIKDNPAKFTDSGIEYLVEEMIKKGASRRRLQAKLAGGASMFANPSMNIGKRNIKSAKETLKKMNIPLVAEDTGKNYGRTIIFDTSTGKLLIRTILRGDKVI